MAYNCSNEKLYYINACQLHT